MLNGLIWNQFPVVFMYNHNQQSNSMIHFFIQWLKSFKHPTDLKISTLFAPKHDLIFPLFVSNHL